MSSEGVSGGIPSVLQLGTNLPALVDYFLRKDRKRYDAFVAAMRERVPGLKEINVETPTADKRTIELVVDGDFVLEGQRVSAGVKLLFFFVALAHHPSLPKIVLVEEPENGLHPKRLADVVRLLRQLTTGKLGGRKAQVIVTTHSPLVLDEVDLDKDQVLVFQRQDDGSRTVNAADHTRLKTFLDEFRLGEVWVNKDEPALLSKAEPPR
jgi:predicted ATPase